MSLEEHRQLQARNTWLREVRFADACLASILSEVDSLGCALEHLDRATNAELRAQQAEGVPNPWQSAGLFYFHTERFYDAIAIFRRLYERLCECQRECRVWLPKNPPLERIAECHERLGHPAISASYLLLAAVSEAIRNRGNVDTGSAVYLKGLERGWDVGKLSAFYADCGRAYDPSDFMCSFPEHLLSALDVPFPMPHAASSELDVYEINKSYAVAIMADLNDAADAKSGKALERLGVYFLGRIPGFDARPGFQSCGSSKPSTNN